MPKNLVINTGPIIALIAALEDLSILKKLYGKVIVPYEVSQELMAKGTERFDAKLFSQDKWLEKRMKSTQISSFLINSLDRGEAAVIQTALNEGIKTVCIDEAVGRRIARLNDLKLTGSLGIIISAIKRKERINIESAIYKMRRNGVWIGNELEKEASKLAQRYSQDNLTKK